MPRQTDDDLLDDDAEMERWFGLTEAERNAELLAAENQYIEWYNTLSRSQVYRYRRRTLLKSCRNWRKHRAAFKEMDIIVRFHKQCQMLLLDARLQYYKGLHTGEA